MVGSAPGSLLLSARAGKARLCQASVRGAVGTPRGPTCSVRRRVVGFPWGEGQLAGLGSPPAADGDLMRRRR